MNNQEESNSDEHDHDTVMPGFRFHPTEEELVEFYLRRKVEGKPFNLELITLLDLYRYDPWELPGLAAIGEKEWYFYVPRDKKYRNGDRPNRVTRSGYWKATGADRIIRSESRRSIGLKKTLVFYSGRAPKGVRSSWIMNEYRLPLHETQRLQKAEISLCRVHKRAGIKDQYPSLPRCLTSPAPSSSVAAPLEDDDPMKGLLQFPSSSHDLHKLVNINTSPSLSNLVEYEYHSMSATGFVSYFPASMQPQAAVATSIVPPEGLMFDWNAISEASKDFTNLF